MPAPNEQPNRPDVSPAILRAIESSHRVAAVANRRREDRTASIVAQRAAASLAGDVARLLDAVLAIANEGVTPARMQDAEGQAATTADTLALFFAATNQALKNEGRKN